MHLVVLKMAEDSKWVKHTPSPQEPYILAEKANLQVTNTKQGIIRAIRNIWIKRDNKKYSVPFIIKFHYTFYL